MIIRNMDHSDVDFAFQCTRSEGWEGETKEVFEGFLSYNQKGCFIAEANSQKMGICIATSYKNNGFIGELVIIKEKRGLGYGGRLFEHALAYFKSSGIENIYLDADPDAASLYEKYGFKKMTRTHRFRGKIAGQKNPAIQKILPYEMDEICIIDKQLFADERSFFLRRRYKLFPDLCLVSKKDNSINGYIFGRPGVNVMSIAPLVVLDNDENTARGLVESLVTHTKNDIYAGVLENNAQAITFFRSLTGLMLLTPGWYMAFGPARELGNNTKLYSIGSAAKG
jgi:ribosomal protein S18 acetylase RimI-like enzyme